MNEINSMLAEANYNPLSATVKQQKKWKNMSKKKKNMFNKYLPDMDNDGVPDMFDCQPRNPKKQDWVKSQKVQKAPGDKVEIKMMRPQDFLMGVRQQQKKVNFSGPGAMNNKDYEKFWRYGVQPRIQNETQEQRELRKSNVSRMIQKSKPHFDKKIGALSSKIVDPKGEMDMPQLIQNKGGKFIMHDGRHRAVAAQRGGIKEIPVIITTSGGDPGSSDGEIELKNPGTEPDFMESAKPRPQVLPETFKETFYHGTTADRAEKIKKEGLKPGGSLATSAYSMREGKPKNYLTIDKQTAKDYARIYASPGQRSSPAIVKVRADPSDFTEDKEFLKGSYMTSETIPAEDVKDVVVSKKVSDIDTWEEKEKASQRIQEMSYAERAEKAKEDEENEEEPSTE